MMLAQDLRPRSPVTQAGEDTSSAADLTEMLNTDAEGEIDDQADAAPSPSALQQTSTPPDPWSPSLDAPLAQPKRPLASLSPGEITGTFIVLVDRIFNVRGYAALLARGSLLLSGVPRPSVSPYTGVYLPAPFCRICANRRDAGMTTLPRLPRMTGSSECGPSRLRSFAWSTLTFIVALLTLSYANRLSRTASGPADSRPVDRESSHFSRSLNPSATHARSSELAHSLDVVNLAQSARPKSPSHRRELIPPRPLRPSPLTPPPPLFPPFPEPSRTLVSSTQDPPPPHRPQRPRPKPRLKSKPAPVNPAPVDRPATPYNTQKRDPPPDMALDTISRESPSLASLSMYDRPLARPKPIALPPARNAIASTLQANAPSPISSSPSPPSPFPEPRPSYLSRRRRLPPSRHATSTCLPPYHPPLTNPLPSTTTTPSSIKPSGSATPNEPSGMGDRHFLSPLIIHFPPRTYCHESFPVSESFVRYSP